MKLPVLLSTVLLAAAVVGCSDDPVDAPSTPGTSSAAVARFEVPAAGLPAFLDVPFPSDAYLEPDGTLVDTLPGLEAYVPQNAASISNALATQHGFGRIGGASFRVDGDDGAPAVVDESSLPATEEESLEPDPAALLVDLDATDAASARVPCRVAVRDDRAAGSESPPVLTVLPARGVVLGESRRYAAVLTTSATADGGVPIRASATLRAIAGGRRETALEQIYGDAIDRVAALVPALADRSRIAAVAPFTTQPTRGDLVRMREIVAELPPPALLWDPADVAPMHVGLFAPAPLPEGWTATLDDWLGAPAKLPDGSDDPAADQTTGAAHAAIAALGTAAFEAPSFLRERSAGYDDPEHRTVARDESGEPVVDPERPTAKIWITIALPVGDVPPEGFPVVIVQHGLSSDRSFMIALADVFARQGWATVAIEAATFGARAVDDANRTDRSAVFAWSERGGYAGPDGFVDKPAAAIALFGGFLSFGAARDQLRQSAIDIGTVTELLRDEALDLGPLTAAVPGARLDGSRVAYVGDSFGAIVGGMVAAVDPRLCAMVLNVGGGGILTEIVANGPGLSTLLGAAGGLTFGLPNDRLDPAHPVLNLLQSVLDPADPLAHAEGIVIAPPQLGGTPNPPKSVALVEALWDEVVANEGSESLARAAGMPLAAPHVGSNAGVPLEVAEPEGGAIRGVPVAGATAVLVQASPATHGGNLYSARGVRHFSHPFQSPGAEPFAVLASDIPVRQPYLSLQRMTVEMFASAFAGEVPAVGAFAPPLRDFDDDGRPDDIDPDPNDPAL